MTDALYGFFLTRRLKFKDAEKDKYAFQFAGSCVTCLSANHVVLVRDSDSCYRDSAELLANWMENHREAQSFLAVRLGRRIHRQLQHGSGATCKITHVLRIDWRMALIRLQADWS